MKCLRCGKFLPNYYTDDMEYPMSSQFCPDCYDLAIGDIVESLRKDKTNESKRLDKGTGKIKSRG